MYVLCTCSCNIHKHYPARESLSLLILCGIFNSLGVGRNFLHMTNVHCTGNETHLWNCPFTNNTEFKCNYYNQVAVHCGMLHTYVCNMQVKFYYILYRLQFINDVWSTSVDWW